MSKPSVLVIEDEENIRELLCFNLQREGYRVDAVGSATEAERHIERVRPELILLDLMLPDRSGLDLCRRLKSRPETASIPVVILTAKGEEADVVVGLEIGADDYITKPFSPRVLLARLRAVLRRVREAAERTDSPAGDSEQLTVGELVLHRGRHEAAVAGRPVSLTVTEFRVLKTLMQRPGWVFTRRQIAEAIHGHDVVGDRAIDVQIVALRRKLGPAGRRIETVRGVGYRLKADYSSDDEPP